MQGIAEIPRECNNVHPTKKLSVLVYCMYICVCVCISLVLYHLSIITVILVVN